jgi:hypothetical protein
MTRPAICARRSPAHVDGYEDAGVAGLAGVLEGLLRGGPVVGAGQPYPQARPELLQHVAVLQGEGLVAGDDEPFDGMAVQGEGLVVEMAEPFVEELRDPRVIGVQRDLDLLAFTGDAEIPVKDLAGGRVDVGHLRPETEQVQAAQHFLLHELLDVDLRVGDGDEVPLVVGVGEVLDGGDPLTGVGTEQRPGEVQVPGGGDGLHEGAAGHAPGGVIAGVVDLVEDEQSGFLEGELEVGACGTALRERGPGDGDPVVAAALAVGFGLDLWVQVKADIGGFVSPLVGEVVGGRDDHDAGDVPAIEQGPGCHGGEQ